MSGHRLPKIKPLALLLILALLLVAAIIAFILLPKTANPITVDQLSPRAQEFITSQNSDGSGFWTQQQLSASESGETSLTQTIDNDCFAVKVPWNLSNLTLDATDDRCTLKARVQSPLAHLVLSTYTGNFTEDSGIVLRRSQKNTYVETSLVSATFKPAVVFRSEDTVIVFAAQQKRMVTISFNDIFKPESITDAELTDVLDNLVLVP